MIDLLNEEVEIHKKHELERFEDFEKACSEVNNFYIQKQKELLKESIQQNFSSKKTDIADGKPKLSTDGKYVFPNSPKGVSPFDIM